MSKTSINVDVITEVKGLQKLKKAQNDMGAFGDAAKKLGKTLAVTFAADRLLAFGKASIKAYADHEKQIALLTATLKNLGQGYKALGVNAFIDHLQLATGVSRDELIPAFQGLFIATGDTTKAQEALQLAMDVSAGTGKDLATVQIALSKGFLGNTTSLTRLGAGLSKTLLQTGDMNKIMKQLALTFKGDAAIAADTVAGKMARLQVSAKEAQETIGGGLVDALTLLAGNTSIETVQGQMQNLATDTADVIRGVGVLLGELKKLPGISNFKLGMIPIIGAEIEYLRSLGQKSRTTGGNGQVGPTQDLLNFNMKNTKVTKERTAAEIAAAKALEKQRKAVADKLALERSSLSLKLAGSTADMQNIEIQAALQRGQTAEVNNVLLLQRAILTGNADQANILAQEVLKANGLVMDVNGNISSLANAKDPFKDWPAASAEAMRQLLAIQAELAKIQSKTITVTVNTVYTSSGTTVSTAAPTGLFPSTGDKGGAGAATNETTPGTTVYNATVDYPNYGMQTTAKSSVSALQLLKTAESSAAMPSNSGGAYDKPIVITVVAAPNLTVEHTQDASTNGTAVTVNRTNPFGLYSAV